MCKTCHWKEFVDEVEQMRIQREYAWNGYLDLLRRQVKDAEHVNARQRQHVADVIRRTEDPDFARAYAATEPPDPAWTALVEQRRRVLALAGQAGYPAGVVLRNGVEAQGSVAWGYWVTAAPPALLARVEVYLAQRLGSPAASTPLRQDAELSHAA